ncbi:MAG: fibronectin type III domain-containing protein, partial [Candidatus Sumerlaeia bacterium]|nr:fibronectin type III domain-containing protein [Candidatus Sumerlaeia bacterium]
VPPPAGSDPTPRRRACLGYHAYSMTTPTVNGILLLQRVVQWTMEDAVNAGEPAPVAPSGLTAAPAGLTGAQLNWGDVQRESGYKIERREGTGPWFEVAIVGANTTQYQDGGLTPGSSYTYRVRAYNPAGNSAYSNEAPVVGQLRTRRWEIYR